MVYFLEDRETVLDPKNTMKLVVDFLSNESPAQSASVNANKVRPTRKVNIISKGTSNITKYSLCYKASTMLQ